MYSISERRMPSTRKPRTNNNQMDEKSLLGLVFIIAALVLVVWWSDTFVELLFLYIPFFFQLDSIPTSCISFSFLGCSSIHVEEKKKEKEESPERICIRISNLTVSAQALWMIYKAGCPASPIDMKRASSIYGARYIQPSRDRPDKRGASRRQGPAFFFFSFFLVFRLRP